MMELDIRHFRDENFIQTMKVKDWEKIKKTEGDKIIYNGNIMPLVVNWTNGEYVEITKEY